MALKPGSEIWNYFTNIVEEGMAQCKLCNQRLRNNRSFNLKLHLKKLHGNRCEIDKYFDVYTLENLAVCKTCGHRLQNRICNLKLHMRRSHNIEAKILDYKPLAKPCSLQPYDEERIKEVLKVAKRKMAEQVSKSVKRPTRRLCVIIEKKRILRSIIGLIVEDGISPSLFSSKYMKTILHSVYDEEHRKFKMDETNIEGIISSVSNYIRNNFSNDLHSRLLSITIDTDVNASPGSFCISAKFIKEDEIQNRILGIITLEDNEQLQEHHIKQILYKYNIDSSQIISASWNHAKHNYNKEVKNSDYLNEIAQFESYPDVLLGEIKVEPYLGSMAQQCLMDIFKNPTIFQHYLECRNLTKLIKDDESDKYKVLFFLNKLNVPQLDSPWAAGSTYKMMYDLNEARNILKTVISSDLQSFIEAFCESTYYLQKSILKYNNEALHMGDFYAQWLKCKLLSEKLSANYNKSNKFLSMILTEVLNAIKKRTNELLMQDHLVACLYLDPRFQSILNTDQISRAVDYLKMMWRRAKLYIVEDSEPYETSVQLFDDDEDAFLNEFLSHDIEMKNQCSKNVCQNISELKLSFQTVDTNILAFWKGQKNNEPEVYMLSTICFAIPATEIFSKIIYSHVYNMDPDSRLSAFTKENILSIRLNVQLLNDALTNLQLKEDTRSDTSFHISDNESEATEISADENCNTVSSKDISSNGLTVSGIAYTGPTG